MTRRTRANFILPQVAYGLDMQIVGVAPAGTGATGAIGGGQEMLLGSAKLGGNRDDVDVALTGLSAAVVPVPAPNTAGILGRSFLDCFGAVEFDWSEGKTGATVCFHESYDFDEEVRGGIWGGDRSTRASWRAGCSPST